MPDEVEIISNSKAHIDGVLHLHLVNLACHAFFIVNANVSHFYT